MGAVTTPLTKDVWTKVLTDVTFRGQIHVKEQLNDLPEPTSYLAAFVDTGASAPAVDFDGGVKFDDSFSPSISIASDYYVMPTDFDGTVVIIT